MFRIGGHPTICLLVLSGVLPLMAQRTPADGVVPRPVNFSGKAADAQGKPIAGSAGVPFAIYRDQYDRDQYEGGWIETQNVTVDAKGNYTAQLGATKAAGLPLDLFTSGEVRWLGVRVNGGNEQPRVLLLSVPYALKAADAENPGGFPLSAFVLATRANGGVRVAVNPSAPDNGAAVNQTFRLQAQSNTRF